MSTETKYKILARQEWTDREPDTCSISLELDSTTGQPFIVVSASATWLTPRQAMEAALFIEDCVAQALQLHRPRAVPGAGEAKP